MPNSNEYIEALCLNCGNKYEVRVDKAASPYGKYCALCFHKYVTLYADGTMEIRDSPWEANTDYKDELEGISHRGKIRVPK